MEREPSDFASQNSQLQVSCDRTMTRKEFIHKLVRKATAAGTLLYGAAIADTFIAPPARAQVSGTGGITTNTIPSSPTVVPSSPTPTTLPPA